MRDEKEERKKQARSNKQTRQSNTAHPRQSLLYMYLRIIWIVFIRFTHNNLWSHPAVEYTRIIGYHWVGYEYDPYKNFRRTTVLKRICGETDVI